MCETGDYPLIIGDKGYISDPLSEMLLELDGIRLFAIKRENQKSQHTPQLRRNLNRIRRRIETTINQLNAQFHLCRTRARYHHQVDRVELRWPSGLQECLEGVEANRTLTLVEGTVKSSRSQ